jgi:hypothetical protein
MVVRVRLNHGVVELPASASAVVFSDADVIRWRTRATPPEGERTTLGEVEIGASVCVERGGAWDDGIVVGWTVHPLESGRFRVRGDVVEYDSTAAAEGEHGPLEPGEPLPELPPESDGLPLGEPLTARELAGAMDCEGSEVSDRAARLSSKEWSRAVSRAIASRPDPAKARRR